MRKKAYVLLPAPKKRQPAKGGRKRVVRKVGMGMLDGLKDLIMYTKRNIERDLARKS